jgi:hypothetical protein
MNGVAMELQRLMLGLLILVCACGVAEDDRAGAKGYIAGPTASAFFSTPLKPTPLFPPAAPNSEPRELHASLVKERLEQPGIAATRLALPAVKSAPVRAFVWSRDLKSGYLLQGNGELRKINFETLTLEAFLDIGRTDGSALALSKEGLLLSLKELQELWTLDEQTLKVTRKLAVPELLAAYSAPTLSHAFALHGVGSPQDSIQVIDLKQNKIAREHKFFDLENTPPTRRPADKRPSSMHWPHMEITRAGDSIVCSGSAMNRVKIDGPNLVWAEQGKGAMHDLSGFSVSSDGKYVLESQEMPARPGVPQWALYPVQDLQAPLLLFPPYFDGFLRTYDAAAGRYLGYTFGQQFATFDKNGKTLRAHQFTEGNDSQSKLFVHPQGFRYLLVTEKALLWVNYPAEGKTAPK